MITLPDPKGIYISKKLILGTKKGKWAYSYIFDKLVGFFLYIFLKQIELSLGK